MTKSQLLRRWSEVQPSADFSLFESHCLILLLHVAAVLYRYPRSDVSLDFEPYSTKPVP